MPISCYSTPFELKYALELSRCTQLFVDAKLLPLILPVAKVIGISPNKIYVLEGEAKGQKTLSGLIAGVRTKSMKLIAVRSAVKNTLALLMFSSGTTGRPKGWCLSRSRLFLIFFSVLPIAIMISHGNLIYNLMQSFVQAKAIEAANPVCPLLLCK